MFSAADGSVLSGPARAPLPAKTVTVTGDSITVT
jgi:Rieske Fe-S protein